MKYTLKELNFAAAVRELASGLRNGARPRLKTGDLPITEVVTMFDKWDAENPESLFVPQALDRIKKTADIIRRQLIQPE